MPKWSRARVSRFSSRSQIGQAEHAVEPVERLGPPLRERLEHDLGVGVGGERAAEGHELLAQVEVVVDLAVVGDRVAPVGGVHRLLAVRDVDDRQPPVGQPARAAGDDALAVRARGAAGSRSSAPAGRGRRGVRGSRRCRTCVGGSSCSGMGPRHPVGRRGPSLPRMPGQTDSAAAPPLRPAQPQLSRPIPEPSPPHHNRSGANLKVPGSGGTVGWGGAAGHGRGRWASSQR